MRRVMKEAQISAPLTKDKLLEAWSCRFNVRAHPAIEPRPDFDEPQIAHQGAVRLSGFAGWVVRTACALRGAAKKRATVSSNSRRSKSLSGSEGAKTFQER